MGFRRSELQSGNDDDDIYLFTRYVQLPSLLAFDLHVSGFFTHPSMAPSSYDNRAAPSGLYSRVVNRYKNDPKSFVNVTPESLFARRGHTWGGNKSTTRFYTDQECSKESEATITLVGEMLGSSEGTAMGALGGTKQRAGFVIPNHRLLLQVTNTCHRSLTIKVPSGI